MGTSTTRHATRPPSAAAIRRKQAECSHPARNVHPTFDARWEVCDLCGLIRPAGSAAPWVIAHDLAQPEPPIPPIFQGYEPQPEPEPEPERCPIASADSDPTRARQRTRIREAYHVEYRPLTAEEKREIFGPRWRRHIGEQGHPEWRLRPALADPTPDALNARILRLAGDYERASLARDFDSAILINTALTDAAVELDRLTDCRYHWPFTILRGRNVIRRARGLELLNP